MKSNVTQEEWQIFREAYQFFAAHACPPAPAETGAVVWWMNTASDMIKLDQQWKAYPLMRILLMAIYEYLELKAKAAGKEVTQYVQEQ